MGWKKRDVSIRNTILQQETALGTRRAPVVAPALGWARLRDQQIDEAQLAEAERARLASEQHQARLKANADAAQAAQRAWAQRRNELRDRVVEVQRALAGAEARVQGSDLDDAMRAACEVTVYRARLEAAQQADAGHASRSPL